MTNAIERLTEALADRYQIQREVGSGGMGTVFLALDLKHERQVAVKLLRPELATEIDTKRFLKEIKIVAGFSHPRILPLYDSGEVHGLLYYVMPYVEGESLEDRLMREGSLHVEEAIEIACQVAEGLSYAHARGVVHRDIKPANILLSDGAVLADFGIATSVVDNSGPPLTQANSTIGTPAYMSPEQAASKRLDRRSDIYSLGCVLYTMLAGDPPFTGVPVTVMAKHITDDVSLRWLADVRNIPHPVLICLKKALAKVPSDRFQTTADFADSLRRNDSHDGYPGSTTVATTRPTGLLLDVFFESSISDDRDLARILHNWGIAADNISEVRQVSAIDKIIQNSRKWTVQAGSKSFFVREILRRSLAETATDGAKHALLVWLKEKLQDHEQFTVAPIRPSNCVGSFWGYRDAGPTYEVYPEKKLTQFAPFGLASLNDTHEFLVRLLLRLAQMSHDLMIDPSTLHWRYELQQRGIEHQFTYLSSSANAARALDSKLESLPWFLPEHRLVMEQVIACLDFREEHEEKLRSLLQREELRLVHGDLTADNLMVGGFQARSDEGPQTWLFDWDSVRIVSTGPFDLAFALVRLAIPNRPEQPVTMTPQELEAAAELLRRFRRACTHSKLAVTDNSLAIALEGVRYEFALRMLEYFTFGERVQPVLRDWKPLDNYVRRCNPGRALQLREYLFPTWDLATSEPT